MGTIVDAHSDILNDIYPRRIVGENKIVERYWVPKMKKGNIDVRVLAIYCESQYLPELALRRALDQISILYEELDESKSAILCKTYYDIIKANKTGKIGFILGMEGSEPLGLDINLLRIFYTLGLRVLSFTHASRTYLADGSLLSTKNTGQAGGLTYLGVAFLEKAQEMGILIDVSHLNDAGFRDVIRFTKAPIIASHSNCRSLCDHPRNLTDEQIKAIVDTGGVIGVNACKLFVEHGDFEHLLGHIDHLVKVGGIAHVGVGPDFADYLPQHMTEAERARLPYEDLYPVSGFSSEEDFPELAERLKKRGYSKGDVELIMGENFMRVFREVFKEWGSNTSH